MNVTDVSILRRLNEAGSPLDLSALAEDVHMSQGTLTERLAELARCGFQFSYDKSEVELAGLPDLLVPEAIAALLGVERELGTEILVLRETKSTNDYAARLGMGGSRHGTVVFAIRQTEGRGRLGRTWYSSSPEGLWFSLLLRPVEPVARWPRLALAAGLGIARATERLVSRPVSIKWPNDVMIDQRKLAGILLESRVQEDEGFVVLGIGINVNSVVFPEEIAGIATSLKLVKRRTFQMNRVAADMLSGLESAIRLYREDFDALLEECAQRDILIGSHVEIRSGTEIFAGQAMQLGSHGGLVVRSADGKKQEILYGEATLRNHMPVVL